VAPGLCETGRVPQSRAPVLALDTASLYFRSYYALPSSMTAPDGRPHNAVRGLLTTMTRLVEAYRPRGLVAAWDDDWRPQWRVDLVPTYKAHRAVEPATEASPSSSDDAAEEVPEELGPQVDAIAELINLMGIPRWGVEHHEADDVLGSIAAREQHTIVVTGDRDLVQLIDDSTRVLLTVNGGMEKWPLLDPSAAVDRFGVAPGVYADMAVLRGDPSDGLPGVPGIGPKTAVALVNAFGDLSGVISAARREPVERPLTARTAARIDEFAEALHRALTVTRVVRDLPLPSSVPPLPLGPADPGRLADLAQAWGVQRQVDELARAFADSAQTLAE